MAINFCWEQNDFLLLVVLLQQSSFLTIFFIYDFFNNDLDLNIVSKNISHQFLYLGNQL